MKKTLLLGHLVLSCFLFSNLSQAANLGIIVFDEEYYQGSKDQDCSNSINTCIPTAPIRQTGDRASCIIAGNRNLKVTSADQPGMSSLVFEYFNSCPYSVNAKIRSGNTWSAPVSVPASVRRWINVSYSSYDSPVEVMFGNPTSIDPNPGQPGPATPYPISSGNIGQCKPGVGSSNIPGHSVINLERQSISEVIPVVGAPFYLSYSSDRFKNGSDYPKSAAPFGGWNISIHHYYDVKNNVVYFGNGEIFRPRTVINNVNGYFFVIGSNHENFSFNADGTHNFTKLENRKSVEWQFEYKNGRVSSVKDLYGRTYSFSSSYISTPGGQSTLLSLDDRGLLSKVVNPNGEAYSLSNDANGRMISFQKPSGSKTLITYDENGNLLKDEGAGGSFITLVGSFDPKQDLLSVKAVTSTNKSTTVGVKANSSGSVITHQSDFGSSSQVTTKNISDKQQESGYVDIYSGAFSTRIENLPEFGDLQAPVWSKFSVGDSIQLERSFSKRNVKGDGASFVETSVMLQNDPNLVFSQRFDKLTRVYSNSTPLKRSTLVSVDEAHNPTSISIGRLSPTVIQYSAFGKALMIQSGDRVQTFSYDKLGNLSSSTDPLNRKMSFEYDKANRPTKQILADGKAINFSYDIDGNLSSLTPPGKPAHYFSNLVNGLVGEYLPPILRARFSGSTIYEYDLDKNLSKVIRPDGAQVGFEYEVNSSRLVNVSTPNGSYGIKYLDRKEQKTNLVKSVNSPDGTVVSYEYLWMLPTLISTTGEIKSFTEFSYDKMGRISSIGSKGADSRGVANKIEYDLDGLIVGVGDLKMTRNDVGAVSATSLGIVSEGIGFNSYGEPISSGFMIDKKPIFGMSYNRDKIGRITSSQDVTATTKVVSTYEYDAQGRLTKSTKGADTRIYSYDANGNRVGFKSGAKAFTGVYDDQDRLLSYGNSKFEYNDNGDLQARADINPDTKEVKTTSYTYDVFGNLRKVVLPDGGVIEYVIDGQNRRIGKKINGKVVQAFIYQSQLQIAAEMDGSGKIVKSFVYASKGNTPDYVNYNGKQFRIISDQVGTPKMVVDSATGAVVESFNFDEFGISLDGTTSAIIPFGFAGGLYDADTGLVRFGARDYSPVVGRWMNKDPIGFSGGQGNLYAYVNNDPINLIDPTGLYSWKQFGKNLFKGLGVGLSLAVTAGFMQANPASIAAIAVGGTLLVTGYLTAQDLMHEGLLNFDGSGNFEDIFHIDSAISPLPKFRLPSQTIGNSKGNSTGCP